MVQRNETKRPGAVSGLRSLQVGVVDFARALDFFTRAWGLAPVEKGAESAYLRATGPNAYVMALHKRPKTEVLRVDMRADSPADVDAIHARLAARGAANLTKPAAINEPGGGYGFTVRDPEGRLLLILAGDTILADSGDAIDLPRKMSHVVLNTPDAPTIEDFYINGLGFRLVDRTRRMAFINCSSDHHSIAIVPSAVKTLNHVAFEMPSFDAVMRGIGRLRDNGFDIGWGVGRHGPGNNIFAYFAGIENLPLEYTAEVQQIDDSYKPGKPEDWAPPPGRRDLWGATGAPTKAMEEAEHTIGFSAEDLRASA